MSDIRTAVVNGVATIEIARPEKKNALTLAMYQAMADALNAARDDPAVRAALITGQPGIFTSGNDLEDFMARPPGQGLATPQAAVIAVADAVPGEDQPARHVRVFARQRRRMRCVMLHLDHRQPLLSRPAGTGVAGVPVAGNHLSFHII